jgi:putative glycosyltransferase (TIGR04372 family)
MVRLALAEQFDLDTTNPGEALGVMLVQLLEPHLQRYPAHQSIAVMFGNYDSAVGHAILDPFHMKQLHQDRFDNLILVHPPLERYAPASRLAVQMLHDHFDQIHTENHILLAMAWQCAGEIHNGRVTFILNNYWSLNQSAARARRDHRNSLSHGRDYLTLPTRIARRAEQALEKRGWDFSRPVVVVHLREHGYHSLSAQSFRNVDPRNYIPGLRWLVEQGYCVVRIGDNTMTTLRDEIPQLVELPLQPEYDHALDLYLLANCRFMISCQSGPCSFARALGRPNLVLNAVYHYSLLPERAELLGFKNYRDAETGMPMGLGEILARGGHLYDRSQHFEQGGILLEDMTAEEILAAVQEMDRWVEDLSAPETRRQRQFRAMMTQYTEDLPREHPLWHPHADYIGYALPECRVLDSLCRARPGYLPLPQTEPARVATV